MADLPCPSCGSPLTFLDQYQRYYCHRCLQYAPEGYGDHGAQLCPTCGAILSYVRQYGRMYCYHCNTYAPEPTPGSTETPAAVPPSSSPSPANTPAVTAASSPPPEAEAPSQPADTSAPSVSVPAPAPPPAGPETEPKAEEPKPEEPEPSGAVTTLLPPVVAEPEAPAKTEPAQPTEPEPAPPSHEMRALAAQKPAAVRVKLFSLKKAELVDLCRVYHLDTSGTKEQLQERLLHYLHDIEAGEPEVEPATREEPAVVTEPAPPSISEGATPVVAQAEAPMVTEEPEPRAATVEAAPAAGPVVVVPVAVAEEAPRPVSKAERPCPTCGRELTFISQYNRYYCYFCQRYAPAGARSKNACPTCGATMRWIDQHHRWWCDDCQKYASPDLPSPGAAAPAVAAASTATVTAPVRTVSVHRHGTPASGAGLVGFGLALYIVYAFFGFLGSMMGFVRPAGITPEMLDLLQFFAFALVALGAVVGLYGVREQE